MRIQFWNSQSKIVSKGFCLNNKIELGVLNEIEIFIFNAKIKIKLRNSNFKSSIFY